MIKALRYEKHLAPLVNHESFSFDINISNQEKEFNKKEKYLAEIESSFNMGLTESLEKKNSSKI